jgi:hypothetical protein
LHDDARPYTAILMKQFLAKQRISELSHPPYSPDLSPPDFFVYPKIKFMLKGGRFDDMEDVKRNATKKLLALHADLLKRSFQLFYE